MVRDLCGNLPRAAWSRRDTRPPPGGARVPVQWPLTCPLARTAAPLWHLFFPPNKPCCPHCPPPSQLCKLFSKPGAVVWWASPPLRLLSCRLSGKPCPWAWHLCARAALTASPRPGALSSRYLFFHSSGGRKSEVRGLGLEPMI